MKNSIKKELAGHLIDLINDEVLTNGNRDDWHFHAFNEDYYIVGYYEASEWLKRHNVDPFEAVGICQDYEREHFGEVTNIYDNSERAVNMLAYIYGEELLAEIDAGSVEELQEELEEII